MAILTVESDSFVVDPAPPPPPEAGYSPEAYARHLEALLPRGLAWVVEAGSVLARLLLAIGDELSRVDARAAALLREADPRTAVETIDDWERVLGLPDECAAEVPQDIENRRRAITQRLASRGGQTPQFFISLAALVGFHNATIEDHVFKPLRVGFRAGDRAYSDGWAHVWRMVLPSGPAELRPMLECAVRRAAPAHTMVFFEYL